MIVTVTFHFSFPNNRIKTLQGSNLKDISFEGSTNTKREEYTFQAEYQSKKEGLFRKNVAERLRGQIRRNPSITKCIFKCDLIPNYQVALREEFNRKLTSEHARKLAVEVSLLARRRFKNPNAFND